MYVSQSRIQIDFIIEKETWFSSSNSLCRSTVFECDRRFSVKIDDSIYFLTYDVFPNIKTVEEMKENNTF